MVYDNVMDLVQAVLDLKNKLCQLPPEAYVMVVKVSGRGRTGTRAVEAAHPSPGGGARAELPDLPGRCLYPGRTPLAQGGQSPLSPRKPEKAAADQECSPKGSMAFSTNRR